MTDKELQLRLCVLILLLRRPNALRSKWLKVRISHNEFTEWKKKAAEAEMDLSSYLRAALKGSVVKNRKEGRELTLLLTRISTNMNQLAAWVNSRKDVLEAVSLIPHLVTMERYLKALFETGRAK